MVKNSYKRDKSETDTDGVATTTLVVEQQNRDADNSKIMGISSVEETEIPTITTDTPQPTVVQSLSDRKGNVRAKTSP